MTASRIVFVGIAPHPPIMVPEVGGEAVSEVRGSIDAMRELSRRVVESRAETLVLISPHAPLEARAFVAYGDARLRGDFANFRAPHANVDAPLDAELLAAVVRAAAEDGLEVSVLEGYEMDHGTVVPLYFLRRNGWDGRALALGYSFLPDEDHVRFGAAVRRAAESVGRRVAFVASGDLSHRLKPDAPAGFFPGAHLFDEEVVAAISDSEPERIATIDPALRRKAGECGYRSMLVALGVADGVRRDCEVLHYEAPFGVGYLVAQLARAGGVVDNTEAKQKVDKGVSSSPSRNEKLSARDEEADSADVNVSALPSLARRAVEIYVRDGKLIEPENVAESPLLSRGAACFVSIKTMDGELRGCIGTIEPACATLAEEIVTNAAHAATRDPRFPPVGENELPHLRYSVDVLFEPEPAEFKDLDPTTYGVIVEDEAGRRRGLLLPDIAGVETADEQVEIAARKAGIAPGEPVRLYRFRVQRFREKTETLQKSSEQGA